LSAHHAGHPDADLLLWRGVEMVEILSMLNMDIETLQAALLFPLADATWSRRCAA
jgi:GTP pyrophosphokinase